MLKRKFFTGLEAFLIILMTSLVSGGIGIQESGAASSNPAKMLSAALTSPDPGTFSAGSNLFQVGSPGAVKFEIFKGYYTSILANKNTWPKATLKVVKINGASIALCRMEHGYCRSYRTVSNIKTSKGKITNFTMKYGETQKKLKPVAFYKLDGATWSSDGLAFLATGAIYQAQDSFFNVEVTNNTEDSLFGGEANFGAVSKAGSDVEQDGMQAAHGGEVFSVGTTVLVVPVFPGPPGSLASLTNSQHLILSVPTGWNQIDPGQVVIPLTALALVK